MHGLHCQCFKYKRMKTLLSVIFFVTGCIMLSAQENQGLTVEKIMSDTVYLGEVPEDVQWEENSEQLYFSWRPMDKKKSGIYEVSISGTKPNPIPNNQAKSLKKRQLSYSKDRRKALFERNGDIFIKDVKNGTETTLVATSEQETNPVFNQDESAIVFQRGQNLFTISTTGQGLSQLTNI